MHASACDLENWLDNVFVYVTLTQDDETHKNNAHIVSPPVAVNVIAEVVVEVRRRKSSISLNLLIKNRYG